MRHHNSTTFFTTFLTLCRRHKFSVMHQKLYQLCSTMATQSSPFWKLMYQILLVFAFNAFNLIQSPLKVLQRLRRFFSLRCPLKTSNRPKDMTNQNFNFHSRNLHLDVKQNDRLGYAQCLCSGSGRFFYFFSLFLFSDSFTIPNIDICLLFLLVLQQMVYSLDM